VGGWAPPQPTSYPAWLRAYPLERFPILPNNAQRIRHEVFGAFGLTHDVMRHTFISMFVGKFRSMGEFWEFLPEDEREIVDVLRQIVVENLPPYCVERFSYNVPCYYGKRRICMIWPASLITRQPSEVVPTTNSVLLIWSKQ